MYTLVHISYPGSVSSLTLVLQLLMSFSFFVNCVVSWSHYLTSLSNSRAAHLHGWPGFCFKYDCFSVSQAAVVYALHLPVTTHLSVWSESQFQCLNIFFMTSITIPVINNHTKQHQWHAHPTLYIISNIFNTALCHSPDNLCLVSHCF